MIFQEVTDTLEFVKIKMSCSEKDIDKRTRREATDWEKVFAKHTSDKGLLSRTKSS